MEIQPLLASEPEVDAPAVLTWSDTECAQEIASAGPRSFLFPGTNLATVKEIEFKDGGTGARVWDASIALSLWLAHHVDLRGKKLLELGAGVGLSGISAALAGANVTLSEMGNTPLSDSTALQGGSDKVLAPELSLLSNLDKNLQLNSLSTIARTLELDWELCLAEGYEPLETYDIVCGSDLVYEGFSVRGLAAAVISHTAPNGMAYLMCDSRRFDVAGKALLGQLMACGTVHLERMTVHNSFGRSELVLATFSKLGSSA